MASVLICLITLLLAATVNARYSMDSACICQDVTNNTCYEWPSGGFTPIKRCNLIPQVLTSLQSGFIPDWVTPAMKTLVQDTIGIAKAGNLSGLVYGTVCDLGGTFAWSYDCTSYGPEALSGWLNLGFHPYSQGNAPGLYLTQIMRRIPYARNTRDCGTLDPYVTVTYINITLPFDKQGFNLNTRNSSSMYLGNYTRLGYVPDLRTDNDLVLNGYDALPCEFDPPGTLGKHVDCGIGAHNGSQSLPGFGSYQCYNPQSSTANVLAKGGNLLWLFWFSMMLCVLKV